MPNNRFLHLLNIHPKYMHLKRHMHHFHQSANHKAHGEGLVPRIHHRKLHHLTGSGDTHFKMGAPLKPDQLGYSGGGAYRDFIPIDKHPVPIRGSDPLAGMGMSPKFRRPAPLKFKL